MQSKTKTKNVVTTSYKMADHKTIDNVENALQSLPDDMMKFSLCMISLYVENNVGSSSDAAVLFQELRDDTRKDAMIYCSGILPFSKKVVSAVDDYFDYYDALDFKDWSEFLPDIMEETKSYRGLCQMTIKMHEDMLIALKPREDEASEIMLQFKELQDEYDQKVKELEDSAVTKNGWAIGLAFIPFINIFASPILEAVAKQDQAKALAKSEEAELQEAAALIVKEELIPALKAFIKGLQTVASFFSIEEKQLQQFVDKGDESQEDPKNLHYNIMKARARETRANCQRFVAVIPAVTTTLASIPTEGTDRNYIEIWLEKQKKAIKKERNTEIKKTFFQVLKGLAKIAKALV